MSDAKDPIVVSSPQGLYCPRGDFHIDPWLPVPTAVLTHAHGDHAHPGSQRYLCSEPCVPIARRRLPEARVDGFPYGQPFRQGEATLSFHPAGHVLGSAQLRIEVDGEVWVVSGDYKRQPDPTCLPFEPIRCDVFITEATFALPIYRWDEPELVAREIYEWWMGNRARKKVSVLYCYVLGKAQRILAELTRFTREPVYVHGMMTGLTELYREQGIEMLPTLPVAETDKKTLLAGELVLAPPSARGTPWAKRFKDYSPGYASGWMRIRGTRRRQGFDRGFVLSDHADWPSLLRTIEETQARRIFVTHGYTQTFARYLCERGYDAQVLETRFEGEVVE